DIDDHAGLKEHRRPAWAECWIRRARLLGNDGLQRNSFSLGEDVVIEMEVAPPEHRYAKWPVMGIVVNHSLRGIVGGINTRMTGYQPQAGEWRGATFRCVLSGLNLLQGLYSIDLWFGD